MVFDSDLQRTSCGGSPVLRFYPTINNRSLNLPPFNFPTTMVKDFVVEYQDENGIWVPLAEIKNNYQRLVKINTDIITRGIKMTVKNTWGCEKALVFSLDAY
ncbi:MAG TPA: hypothetical protein DIW17_12490 [Clostridiales bacterium]|nr:hypothetical protein [Clostridiales bacterium]